MIRKPDITGGFHGISQEGCFICKVQESDVKRGRSGVMFVNQRPIALQNTHRIKRKLKLLLTTSSTSQLHKHKKHVNIQGTSWVLNSIG